MNILQRKVAVFDRFWLISKIF